MARWLGCAEIVFVVMAVMPQLAAVYGLSCVLIHHRNFRLVCRLSQRRDFADASCMRMAAGNKEEDISDILLCVAEAVNCTMPSKAR